MVFTGQEHDEKTGLIYFGARYYDPDSGRFITQDTYLGETGTPPSLHRYLYAYSNPTVYIDLFGYISNRQIMGVDDDSVDRTLAEDNSLSSVLKLTAKSTLYTLWNGVTGGFVSRQDDRQEKYDRGELTDGEFWTGTGIDGGVSLSAQLVGGAAAGKATGAVGGRLAGAAVGGAVDSGVTSLLSQTGQVATFEITDGKLGQESVDFGEVAVAAGSGAVVGSGLYAGQKVAGAVAAGAKAVREELAPKLSREVRDGVSLFENAGGRIRHLAADQRGSIGLDIGSSLNDDYVVSFMGKNSPIYYDSPVATLGARGGTVWVAPSNDVSSISSRAGVVTATGHAPGPLASYLKGDDIYGIAMPRSNLKLRLPTKLDAGANRHFRLGGETGVEHNGIWKSSKVREFVLDGGDPMPKGSVFFKFGQDGSLEKIRSF